ncbi:C-terminal binding protein [Haloferax mediterranei ATCC 33500]|uniref:C-terminal binding protein n=2 Tax=Haloferacaceae TaxID=1644056 RepID=I3R1Y6_HALMT|nr:D-3-phosphoglycerate dehydrogenase [Haloferax mediterranei ATCC 33500]EMA02483.1 D-3-phosphoglycerate dehydrogenase [Haloferax mediterranei ATCC 33500]QCQ74768.1 C-terminal binding protein [Haloferax mediterranei ATCC 33500]
MVDPAHQRRVLGDVAEVTVAELGSEAALVEACRDVDADAVVTDINTPVTADSLAELDLQVVARAAVGFDNIDVDAAAEHGVVVTNVPAYCTDEVATHSVALLLSCIRATPSYDRAVRAGDWPATPGRDLHRMMGRTLGFLSFGAIAQRTAELCSGFGLDFVAYDPYVGDDVLDEYGVERVSLDELYDRADYLSVNAPATPETRGMVDSDAFDALSDDAIVVNTGRGEVIDEDALVDALREGDIAAAGLDVFEKEPLAADSPLRELENAVLSPHAAWCSVEAKAEVNEQTASDIKRVFAGEEPTAKVEPEWD